MLADSASDAGVDTSVASLLFVGKKFPGLILKGAVGDKGLKVAGGASGSLHVGDRSALFVYRFLVTGTNRHHRKVRLRGQMDIGLALVDRVFADVILISEPGGTIPRSAPALLLNDVTAHVRVGLTPVNTAPPTISGGPYGVAAQPGSWTNAPASYTYQWLRCTAGTCTAITGATASSYTPTAADVGSTIEVTVTASNVDGTSKPATSVPTPTITAP
jgi:hypothetical protein